MPILHLVILAAVQGITEFLPISSSGHLVLAPIFLGWPDQGLMIDVAVHVGTLLAVVLYLYKDVGAMLARIGRMLKGRRDPGRCLRGADSAVSGGFIGRAARFLGSKVAGTRRRRISAVERRGGLRGGVATGAPWADGAADSRRRFRAAGLPARSRRASGGTQSGGRRDAAHTLCDRAPREL